MTTLPNRIVRESAVLDQEQHALLGPVGVKRLMREVERKARATAKRIGIKRVAVRGRTWDLDVACGFTDYSMYLCGPGAPRIRSAADVFEHVWHLDRPVARYTVVLDDQDDLDRCEAEWMAGLVEQACTKGLDSLKPQWADNVVERVRKAMGQVSA